jgi:hypothetical protein
MNDLNPNFIEGSILLFDLTFINNLLRINPYLHNQSRNESYLYKQEYYSIFEDFIVNSDPCVVVNIENNSYIIDSNLLINNYYEHHDNSIYFDNYKVNCYPGSKLWKRCKLSIQDNKMYSIRIHNFIKIVYE